ncbi:hypothetical protein ACWEBX_03370 [Streptomyces sp. NPDC005070]
MSADRWTSDNLLTQQGVETYAQQVRELFRRYADEFDVLAREVYGDMVADPIEGDGKIAARYHAWQLAASLRSMARRARSIVDDAQSLKGTYRRVCIELPEARERKAAMKELQKAGQAMPTAAPVNSLAAAIAHRAQLPAQPGDHDTEQTAPARPVTPWGDLFKEAK